jgi:hypothetical protein
MRIRRSGLIGLFGLALAWAQFRESGAPELAARLELVTDPARLPDADGGWAAARVTAQKFAGEPDTRAHTNPLYLGGNSVPVPEARRVLAARWKAELDWYRSGPLQFASEELRQKFFREGEKALETLSASGR